METEQTELVESKPEETKKSNKSKIIIGIISGSVGCLLAAYVITAVYYSNHFFPGTVINGKNYGSEDVIAVMAVLSSQLQDYQLELRGRDPQTGESCRLTTILAQDIDLRTSTGETDVENVLERQNEWLWPVALSQKRHEYLLEGSSTFDADKLEAFLEGLPAFQESEMKDPENAYIKGYSEEEKCYVLEPETSGTRLDVKKAKEAVRAAVENGERFLDFEELDFYAKPAVTTEDAGLQKIIQEANQYLRTDITYDWHGNEVILNADQLKDWVSIQGEKVVLDEEAVADFVAANAKKYNTFGRNRKFTTTLGVELKLPSAYGWQVNRKAETEELIGLIKEGTVGQREPVYIYQAWCKGADDVGNSYVEIDITNQHLYLYENGEIILESDFVSGNMSTACATPPGVFGITYKTTDAILRAGSGPTPVKYWMPFNGNVGMHDATWRRAFGGEIYKTNGSHGCINLPLSIAKEIYPHVDDNFPVICYYYSMEEYELGRMSPEERALAEAQLLDDSEGQGAENTEGQEQTGPETPQPEASE